MLALLFIATAAVALLDSAAAAVGATSTNMLSFTSGADGLVISGPSGASTGYSVVQIGDYNNDGIADFAVSSPSMYSSAGLTVIVLGHSGNWADMNMNTVTSSPTARRIRSTVTDENSGTSLGGAGDVNGDGFADLLLAANLGGSETLGTVYVIFGKAGPYTDLVLGDSLMVGNNGYAIYGSQMASYLGYLNSNTRGLMGDVNGDGVDDFAISAFNYDYKSRSNSGAAWLIYGSTVTPAVNIQLSALTDSIGVLIGGAKAGDVTGYGVDGAGDFNADGIVDIIIGAYGYDPVVGGVTRTNGGCAYLIYGALSMTEIDLNSFTTGSKGVVMLGAANNAEAGYSVSGAGDINDDGVADILVGSPYANGGAAGAGKMYVIYGSAVARTTDIDLLSFTAGAAGFAVLGGGTNMRLGAGVSRAGDMNSDGVNDMLVGAANSESAYIIYGSSALRTADVNVQSAADVYTFAMAGGTVLYGGMDMSGDGYPDILLGFPSGSSGGAAYMVLGPLPRAGTFAPSRAPTQRPSRKPTFNPTRKPTFTPSASPTRVPTWSPTYKPSAQPSRGPTCEPTTRPTGQPSSAPSSLPSAQPSGIPSSAPSAQPVPEPTSQPSVKPSSQPTSQPSAAPSADPTAQPSSRPSAQPVGRPSSVPTSQPSAHPTSRPSGQPSAAPSAEPTAQPSSRPSVQPTSQPTGSAAPTAEAVIESGGSTSATLSDGGIAGVVVGGVLFLVLLGIIIALCFVKTAQASQAAGPAPATTVATTDGAQYEMTSVEEVA